MFEYSLKSNEFSLIYTAMLLLELIPHKILGILGIQVNMAYK